MAVKAEPMADTDGEAHGLEGQAGAPLHAEDGAPFALLVLRQPGLPRSKHCRYPDSFYTGDSCHAPLALTMSAKSAHLPAPRGTLTSVPSYQVDQTQRL